MSAWINDFQTLRRNHKVMSSFLVFMAFMGILYFFSEVMHILDVENSKIFGGLVGQICFALLMTVCSYPFGHKGNGVNE